jgi:hypothetical protein
MVLGLIPGGAYTPSNSSLPPFTLTLRAQWILATLPKIQFQDGIVYKISDNICYLQDLVAKLMQQQGIILLQELSTEGKVQVLYNIVSNKIHLIIDTPTYSAWHLIHKKAVANWLCKYLYDSANLFADYTMEKWHDIFDLKIMLKNLFACYNHQSLCDECWGMAFGLCSIGILSCGKILQVVVLSFY